MTTGILVVLFCVAAASLVGAQTSSVCTDICVISDPIEFPQQTCTGNPAALCDRIAALEAAPPPPPPSLCRLYKPGQAYLELDPSRACETGFGEMPANFMLETTTAATCAGNANKCAAKRANQRDGDAEKHVPVGSTSPMFYQGSAPYDIQAHPVLYVRVCYRGSLPVENCP